MGTTLSWDPEKADANWEKHGVSFEEAGTIFDDPLFVDFFDPDHSDDEQWFVAIGQSSRNRGLLVSYSEWANSIRIISAREATRRERKRCPLCGGTAVENFHADQDRAYLRCHDCCLVFVPAPFQLDPIEEKARYDLHENDPDDPGYRRFLSRLTVPLLERIGTGKTGLDFGCGPGPALPAMLEEHGHIVDRYDPFYFNEPAVFGKTYDFICATEVVEHLRNPGRELKRLFSLLTPGGWLAVMTKMVIDREAFQRWHYIRDWTHIAFFSRETFEFVAERFGVELIFVGKDVVLMRKSCETDAAETSH